MIFKHWAFVEGGCLNTGSLDLASSLEDWLCIKILELTRWKYQDCF
jgi:hypothetical protein